MLPIRTVLHPTDLSELSGFAFRLACSVAHDYDARLVVLHVVEPPVVVGGEGAMLLAPAVDLERLRQQLEQLRPKDPKIRLEHRMVQGDAATEILAAADASKCDLIVLATHGRTGLGRIVLGSVAEQVVRKASCPVLTVKTPRHAPPAEEPVAAVQAAK